MEFLSILWLPILLSAVAVFVASSVFHMALPIHRGDTRGFANETEVLDALRAQDPAPGNYMFPFCGDMKNMGKPDYVAKLHRGPVGFVTLVPNGPLKFGTSLVQWFLYTLVVGVLIAWLGHETLGGAGFGRVFRVLGTAAILPYAFSYIHDLIWKGRSFRVTVKFMVEGVVYGLVTGAIFAWLWPVG